MRSPVKAAVLVIVLMLAMCFAGGVWWYGSSPRQQHIWHHELASGADPAIGETTLPADYMVSRDFTSHLPLIVIDTGGQEIVNYKYYDQASDSFRYQDGVDPYQEVTVEVIDHENHVNRLSGPVTYSANGKIKIRGNSSSALDKKQYRLQLLNEGGEKKPYPLLGLDQGAEWVLNGAQRDYSYMRNYLGYNLSHMMDACSPEVRFCEVLMKEGSQYRYDGLYLLIEPIERGEGRIDIERYQADQAASSYIVRRDREDPAELRVTTYADESGIVEQWEETVSTGVQLSLVYPKEDKVTDAALAYIAEDISKAERVIYSTNAAEFRSYPAYIDVDSFVNYFIVNEYLMSYDAGLHSTYMYKDLGGKIMMGPYWDFDGAVDNSSRSLTNFNYIVMYYRPWFDRLCQSEFFAKALEKRYHQLREDVLSDEAMEETVFNAVDFLGNALERDWQRWGEYYGSRLSVIDETATNISVDRNRSDFEGEVARLLDALSLHAEYLDQQVGELEGRLNLNEGLNYVAMAIAFLLIFFVTIVLIQRARRG